MIRFETISEKERFTKMYHEYLKELSLYSKSVIDMPDDWIIEHYFNESRLQKRWILLGGMKIGFIILQYVDKSCGIDPPLWYIVEFYIIPKYRNQGHGTKAVSYFLKIYPGDFFYYVLKRNTPAKVFWTHITRNFNLKEISRSDVVDADLELETHVFQRS